MLTELHIRALGVIDDVTLALPEGLTVLTGETGAGKTMVVSALELLCGGRADPEQVRRGARTALIEGLLQPAPAGAAEWVDAGDDELLVSREVAQEGRGRARLGGRLAPVSALAQTVGAVIELHGQSDSARLSQPATQRELLDRSGGAAVAAALGAYQEAYGAWRAAHGELATLQGDERERARQVDRLAFELGEIDAVSPLAGEDEELAADLRRLEHAETLIQAAAAANQTIAGDGGGRDALGAAVAALRGVAGLDPTLDELLGRTEGLAAEAQDVGVELADYAEALELDPARLAELRARQAALAGLIRKYGPDLAAVLAYADDTRAQLAALEGGHQRRAALEHQLGALQSAVVAAGAQLTARRRAAGDALAVQVQGHLADLAMGGAAFSVTLTTGEPGATGCDRLGFLLAANPGEPALPLGKAASGGERSRVALALRLALADADATPVLVFDEVDAGIGGAVGVEVGRKLAHLAQGRQVLCVTHLPQLAAFADTHFTVAKATRDGRTSATVRPLEDAERVVELSRMLSGSPDSHAAARHAAEMLASARRP